MDKANLGVVLRQHRFNLAEAETFEEFKEQQLRLLDLLIAENDKQAEVEDICITFIEGSLLPYGWQMQVQTIGTTDGPEGPVADVASPVASTDRGDGAADGEGDKGGS